MAFSSIFNPFVFLLCFNFILLSQSVRLVSRNPLISRPRHVIRQSNQSECALFMGSWVHDETYPIYQASKCPIIDPEFNCQMYGRPDSNYLKYRWKPANCELPRYYYNTSSFKKIYSHFSNFKC